MCAFTHRYYGTTGSCSSDSSDFKVTVTDYYSVSGESSMATYVGETGPLSVCLDASSWNSYTGGIMKVCGCGSWSMTVRDGATWCLGLTVCVCMYGGDSGVGAQVCGNSVDHCVQAVGVDTGNGYWKV